MKTIQTKKIKLRKTNIGKNFIKFLVLVGYSKESVNKAFQNKLNPSVKDALKWQAQYNVPVDAWQDIKKYLFDLIEEEKAQKEEGDTSSTEKASA